MTLASLSGVDACAQIPQHHTWQSCNVELDAFNRVPTVNTPFIGGSCIVQIPPRSCLKALKHPDGRQVASWRWFLLKRYDMSLIPSRCPKRMWRISYGMWHVCSQPRLATSTRVHSSNLAKPAGTCRCVVGSINSTPSSNPELTATVPALVVLVRCFYVSEADAELSQVVAVDAPGHFDTRGVEIDIATTAACRQVAQECRRDGVPTGAATTCGLLDPVGMSVAKWDRFHSF